MSIEAECLALAERQARVPCGEGHYPDVGVIGQPHGPCPSCGGDLNEEPAGVKAPLALSVVRALTVPCLHPESAMTKVRDHTWRCVCGVDVGRRAPVPAPGRVPRDPPGQVQCRKQDASMQSGEHVERVGNEDVLCSNCGGSGTVAGTDEASVTARDEACGRLWRVERILRLEGNWSKLSHALRDSDYTSAMAALRDALKSLVEVAHGD